MEKKESLFIGLDLGTTHIKAVAYNKYAEIKGVSRIVTPAHVNQNGGTYHLADELWKNTIKVIQDCLEQIQGNRVKGIGIASAAESGVLLDKQGDPVGPILAWYDERPNKYIENVKNKVPALDFYRKTGLYPKAKYSLMKFIWMKNNMRDSWKKGSSWLHLAEYIAYRMTGVKRNEISLSSRTMLFNINTRQWDEELLREFSINNDLFEPIVQSGQITGYLKKEISKGLNITEGIPITIAGHDHIVGSFGIGSVHDGDVTNSCGTAETLVATTNQFNIENIKEIPKFTIGCHVIPNQNYILMPVGTTGGIIEWFLNIMKWDYDDLLDTLSKKNSYNNSLSFMPAPMGDFSSNIHTQMAWFGGALSHAYPSQMATAMIQGLSFLFKYQIDYLKELGIDIDRIMVTGGAIKNKYWLQSKSDILYKSLQIIHDSEGVARGAAIMAAKASEEISEISVPSSYTIIPDEKSSKEMQSIYKNSYINNIKNIRNMSL